MGILDIVLQSSTSVSLLLAVLLLIYFFSSSVFSSQEDRKEPPGPRPLPLVGNLLQLDLKKMYITLLKLYQKYGSVFTIYLGPKKVVVLAGYKTVREALVDYADEFGERDEVKFLNEFTQGNGILLSNGDSWKDMRRFALTNLKDFGMGRRPCEDTIIEESHYLVEVLKTYKGKAFDTSQPVNCAVCNIICSVVYGSRFEYDDPKFISLIDRARKNTLILGGPTVQMYNLFPWIGKLFPDRREYRQLFDDNKKQNLEMFSHLKKTLNPHMCRGFVDAFLVHKQNLEDSGNTNSHFHYDNLMITVQNLFVAGTDTTSATVKWTLLFMAKYPKIQDQVQDEISRVIGSRQVQAEDRKNLPFINAVVHETQRLISVLPFLHRRTTQDVTFKGYFIKKGTAVFPLMASVLHDENEWEKPNTFYPAHFLDQKGKFVKRDAFLVFSAGRRACIGESLARMELFIFFTTLLQHFRFTPPPGVSEDELDLTPLVGLTLNPKPHELCAVPLM